MKLLALALVVMTMALMASTAVMAQEKGTDPGLTSASNFPVNLNGIGACIGAGLLVIGGAYGIGRIGGAALEASGRQPEAAAQFRTTAIIMAALIEGAIFFGLAICILTSTK